MPHSTARTHNRPLRLAVDLPGPEGAPSWAELTLVRPDDPATDPRTSLPSVIRIRAADLRETAKIRDRVRAESRADGRDPDGISVLVDLEVVVANEARSARRQHSILDRHEHGGTLSYVGTPSGLAGLIADIHTTRVADGVTLIPLGKDVTVEHILDDTVPWLESHGLFVSSPSAVEVVRSFDRGERRLVPAS